MDTLSPEDFHRLLVIKSKHWDDFEVTGNDETDLARLKKFCTPDWPETAKKVSNSERQSVVDYLLLEAFKCRVGATNEASGGYYPEDTVAMYACEYWRINAAVMVIGTSL